MSFTFYYKEKFDRAGTVGARFAAANSPDVAGAVRDALRLMGLPYSGIGSGVRVVRSNQSVKAIEVSGSFPLMEQGSMLPLNVPLKVVSNPPPYTPVSYLAIAVTREWNFAHPNSLSPHVLQILTVPVVVPPLQSPPDYSWALVPYSGGGSFDWVDRNGTGGYGGCAYPITEYAFSGLAVPANQPAEVFSH
jgi:hypothetical protein